MPQPDQESEQERIWKLLSEADLIDISPEKLPSRIKEAKQVIIGRLSELLQVPNSIQERESAACSLATLRRLEAALTSVRGTYPR